MTGVGATRGALIGLGSVVTAYGVFLLLSLGWSQIVSVGVWLVAGPVVHDGILAPAVIAVVALVGMRVEPSLRTPLMWVLVVLGPLTLVAVPVLGRFGAKADNPTLLDRNYLLGYAVIVALVAGAAAVAALRRRPRGESPTS